MAALSWFARGDPSLLVVGHIYTWSMATIFKVRFADGSGQSFCGSVEEARRWVDLRANVDPTPPGILPAAIFELTDSPTFSERLVERYPHD